MSYHPGVTNAIMEIENLIKDLGSRSRSRVDPDNRQPSIAAGILQEALEELREIPQTIDREDSVY